MIFTSISFIYYFLPIVLIVYFLMPFKYKNLVLLTFSMLFYFYGEPKYIVLMIFEVLISYFASILIGKNKNKKVLISTVAIHIALLCVFKYLNFFTTNLNYILKTNIPLLNLVLPIGISFYTFQILSYEIDVYKGKVEPQKSLIKLATYVFLFPQLIAGPIVRYETVEKELNNRKHSFENFADGATRFTIGLGKKVIIANTLGELCNIFLTSQDKSILFYWMFAIGYMLQIYFDFSGYSDIAIGLGRIFGFHFPENFNYPYIANSITEFWRRWHMSLSSWFRDYVYIPLGGNRKGARIQIRNILIVWGLTGLWHGANWNFIIWGLFFGLILIFEKFIFNKYLNKLPKFIQRLYTLFIVMISFIIFQAKDMGQAWGIIKGLFAFNSIALANRTTIYYLMGYIPIIIVAIIGATPLLKNFVNKLKETKFNKLINIIQPVFMIVLLVIVTSSLIDNSYNPFLYFRF